MKIKNPFVPKKVKDKWQLLLFIDKRQDVYDPLGWHRFNFGVVKFTEKLEEGMPWAMGVEKGFWWRIMFFFPLDSKQE